MKRFFHSTHPLLLTAMAIVLLAGCGEAARPPVDVDAPIEARIEQAPTAWPSPSANPAPTVLSGSSTSSPEFSYSLLVGQSPANAPRYHRDDWRHWIDKDGDCQNTRAEVLIEESSLSVAFDGCRVVSGQWLGLYTGTVETAASSLDVDHMVPLANAHRSGGWAWDPPRKQAFANDLNDPDHLIAVTAGANRSKGADGPEDWRPPDKSYWCEYALDWTRIKEAWGLSVTQAELQALQEMVGTCPFNVELAWIGAPASQIQVMATPTPSAVDGTLLYDPAGPDRNCGDFKRWASAQAFYEAAGGPGSDPHQLDRNKDGVVCEGLPGAP